MSHINRDRVEEIRAMLTGEQWTLGDLRAAALDLLLALDHTMRTHPALQSLEQRERMARMDATARALMAARGSADPRGCYDSAAWLEREREQFIEREAAEAADAESLRAPLPDYATQRCDVCGQDDGQRVAGRTKFVCEECAR